MKKLSILLLLIIGLTSCNFESPRTKYSITIVAFYNNSTTDTITVETSMIYNQYPYIYSRDGSNFISGSGGYSTTAPMKIIKVQRID